MPLRLRNFLAALVHWIDADHAPGAAGAMGNEPGRIDWARCIPFIILHARHAHPEPATLRRLVPAAHRDVGRVFAFPGNCPGT